MTPLRAASATRESRPGPRQHPTALPCPAPPPPTEQCRALQIQSVKEKTVKNKATLPPAQQHPPQVPGVGFGQEGELGAPPAA